MGQNFLGKMRLVRRPPLSEDGAQPKGSSDSFKALRAKHYNEFAALKAFKKHSTDSEASEQSSESEETRTNTNTNINKTISKATGPRPSMS